MKFLRRILGVLIMVAGVLGLLLSLAGLIGIWLIMPNLTTYAKNTITTLETSVRTSEEVMRLTVDALGATIESVNALSEMLSTTAVTLAETRPVVDQVNLMMSETVPTSLVAAQASLKTAQQAAAVLDSTVKSLENFRIVLSATPILGALVEQPAQVYDPEVPLADSLGELAATLEDLPDTFIEMAENLGSADANLASIQSNLTTMAGSVKVISKSLHEYQVMVNRSAASLEDIDRILTNIENSLDRILRGVSIGLSLFLLWLLAAQAVILSQGWELFQGTADRIGLERSQTANP